MQFEPVATGLRRRPAPRGNWKLLSRQLDYPLNKDGLLHSNFSLVAHAPTFSPPHSVFMRSQILLSSVSSAGISTAPPCVSRGARGHGWGDVSSTKILLTHLPLRLKARIRGALFSFDAFVDAHILGTVFRYSPSPLRPQTQLLPSPPSPRLPAQYTSSLHSQDRSS